MKVSPYTIQLDGPFTSKVFVFSWSPLLLGGWPGLGPHLGRLGCTSGPWCPRINKPMVPSGGMIKKLCVNNYIGSFSSLSLSFSPSYHLQFNYSFAGEKHGNMGEPRRIRNTWLEVRHLFLIIKWCFYHICSVFARSFNLYMLLYFPPVPNLRLVFSLFMHTPQLWRTCESCKVGWTMMDHVDRRCWCPPSVDRNHHVCCHLWQTWQSTIDNEKNPEWENHRQLVAVVMWFQASMISQPPCFVEALLCGRFVLLQDSAGSSGASS